MVETMLGDRSDHQLNNNLTWWGIPSWPVDVHVIDNFLAADSTMLLIEALSARDMWPIRWNMPVAFISCIYEKWM